MQDDANKNLFKRGQVWWLEVKVSGTKIRESLDTSDVRIARKRRDKRVEEIQITGGARLTWAEVVNLWAIDWSGKKGKSPKTTKRYMGSLEQVRPHLIQYDVHKIDGNVIRAMIAARKAAGASEPTIRRDLTAVSSVLKFAEDNNWREGNPAIAKRRMLAESNEPIVLPSNQEIEAVLAACPDRFAAMVKAARLTGCRQGELVSVRWDNFDERRRTLTVIGKRNKRRTIDLSQEAFDLLQSHARVDGSPLIFCREDGMSYLQAASDFCFFRAQANKERKQKVTFRFHDLRHLYAVEALHGGMSIYELQKTLGHTTIKMTERYLEHLSPKEQAHAMRGEVMPLSAY